MTTPASVATLRAGYYVESAWGTAAGTPVYQIMRVTDAGIRTNKTTKPVRELRTNRDVIDEPQTAQTGSAAYKFALSYGSFEDFMQAALHAAAWSGNAIGNGTTRTSFQLEEMVNLNGALSFSRMPGGMVDTFDLDVTAEADITGGFSMKGQKETLDTAIVSGATYTATNTKAVMSAGVSVGSLAVASLTSPKVRKVTLAIKNGLRNRHTVDSLYTEAFGEDLIDVTGMIELYFTSNAHYQKVLDHGGGDLAFTLGQVTAEKYTFDMPNIVFLDGARQVGGAGNDVMVQIPYRAKYNSGTSNTMSITRAVA